MQNPVYPKERVISPQRKSPSAIISFRPFAKPSSAMASNLLRLPASRRQKRSWVNMERKEIGWFSEFWMQEIFLSEVPAEVYEQHSSAKLATYISGKALRYDLTVPFARYVVQHQNDLSFPFKRYQIQPVWRADRPQKRGAIVSSISVMPMW